MQEQTSVSRSEEEGEESAEGEVGIMSASRSIASEDPARSGRCVAGRGEGAGSW